MNADERAPTLADAERALLGTPDDCACDENDPCQHHQGEAHHLLALAHRLAGEVEALRGELIGWSTLDERVQNDTCDQCAARPLGAGFRCFVCRRLYCEHCAKAHFWPKMGTPPEAAACLDAADERDTLRTALQALVDDCAGSHMVNAPAYQNAVAALRGRGGGG